MVVVVAAATDDDAKLLPTPEDCLKVIKECCDRKSLFKGEVRAQLIVIGS